MGCRRASFRGLCFFTVECPLSIDRVHRPLWVLLFSLPSQTHANARVALTAGGQKLRGFIGVKTFFLLQPTESCSGGLGALKPGALGT